MNRLWLVLAALTCTFLSAMAEQPFYSCGNTRCDLIAVVPGLQPLDLPALTTSSTGLPMAVDIRRADPILWKDFESETLGHPTDLTCTSKGPAVETYTVTVAWDKERSPGIDVFDEISRRNADGIENVLRYVDYYCELLAEMPREASYEPPDYIPGGGYRRRRPTDEVERRELEPLVSLGLPLPPPSDDPVVGPFVPGNDVGPPYSGGYVLIPRHYYCREFQPPIAPPLPLCDENEFVDAPVFGPAPLSPVPPVGANPVGGGGGPYIVPAPASQPQSPAQPPAQVSPTSTPTPTPTPNPDPKESICGCLLTKPITLQSGKRYEIKDACPEVTEDCIPDTKPTKQGYCRATKKTPEYVVGPGRCDHYSGNELSSSCQQKDDDRHSVFTDSDPCEGLPQPDCNESTTVMGKGYYYSYSKSCTPCSRARAVNHQEYPQQGERGRVGVICEWANFCSQPRIEKLEIEFAAQCEWRERDVPGSMGKDGYIPPNTSCDCQREEGGNCRLDKGEQICGGNCDAAIVKAEEYCQGFDNNISKCQRDLTKKPKLNTDAKF